MEWNKKNLSGVPDVILLIFSKLVSKYKQLVSSANKIRSKRFETLNIQLMSKMKNFGAKNRTL